jgi:hypothetical protein
LQSFNRLAGDSCELVRKVLASNLIAGDKLHVVTAIVRRYSSPGGTSNLIEEDVPLLRRPRACRPAVTVPTPTPPASDVEPGLCENEVGDHGVDQRKRRHSPAPTEVNKKRKTFTGRSTSTFFDHEELYFIFAHGLRGQRGMKMEWGECVRQMRVTFNKSYDHNCQGRVSKVYSQLKREVYGVDVYSKAFDELLGEMNDDREPDFAVVAERLEERFSCKFAVEELRRAYHVRYQHL